MLSYRHAFHAGNHADVVKHIVLQQVLEYFTHKDKPFLYVDTHAGAGLYDLRGGWASKNREYESGIGRIWKRDVLPAELQSYIDMIRELNSQDELQEYPGSPWIAQHYCREQDRAWLFELHSRECQDLGELFAMNKQIHCEQRDGFQALDAILPPAERRAVILIDPSYEIKTDYKTVIQTVKAAYKKFATGCYLVWYPVVNRDIVQKMERGFVASGMRNIMLFELAIAADAEDAGMTASGMIVVNPPWQLESVMQKVLPWLQETLAVENGSYRVLRLADE